MPRQITIGGRTFKIELVDPQAFKADGDAATTFKWDLNAGVIRVADPGDPFIRNQRVNAAVNTLRDHLESGPAQDC